MILISDWLGMKMKLVNAVLVSVIVVLSIHALFPCPYFVQQVYNCPATEYYISNVNELQFLNIRLNMTALHRMNTSLVVIHLLANYRRKTRFF